MDEGVGPESFAAQREDGAICGGRRGVAVLESAFRAPPRLGVVEHHALQSGLAQLAPHLAHVLLEVRIGVIEGHVRLVVAVLDREFGDVVVQHVSGKRPGVIVAGHAGLEVGEGQAAALEQGPAPFCAGLVGLGVVAELSPVLVVPPALLGIAVVLVGHEAQGHRGVSQEPRAGDGIHLLDQPGGVVDFRAEAEILDVPRAQRGKRVDVRAGVLGGPHRQPVSLQGLERVRRGEIHIEPLVAQVRSTGLDEFADGVGSPEVHGGLPAALAHADPFAKLVIG